MHPNGVSSSNLSRRHAVVCALVFVIVAGACVPAPAARMGGPTNAAVPKHGGSLTIGIAAFETLDPNKWGGGYDTGVGFQVYDGLVDVEVSEPRIRPWLAESWSVSADGTTYTFKLKQGVRFHDGTTFDAAAARQAILHVSPTARQGILADLAGNLADVRAVAPDTLEVQLKTPSTGFLGTLQFVPMVSPTAWSQWGDDIGQHPVGTGPFKLKDWVPQDHLTLERNPEYAWPPNSSVNPGEAYVETLTFRFINDAPARLISLESDDAQLITSVPLQDAARLGSDSRYTVAKNSVAGMPLSLYLNVNRGPLAEKAVRTAIQSALDRAELNKTAGYDQSIPASGLLNSAVRCFSSSIVDPFPHDPAHARQLLDADGWLPGADGIRQKNGAQLSFEVAHFPDYSNLAVVIQGELREAGINAVPKMVSGGAALAPVVRGGLADAWIVAQAGNDPSVLATQFHSRTIGNSPMSGAIVADPHTDQLLDEAVAERDPARQCALYDDFQRSFLAEASAFPIWEITLPVGYASRLHGVRLQPMNGSAPRFQEIWLDR